MSAWADNITSIFPASINSLKLKFWGAAADDAYYAIPALTEASAKLLEYTENDSYGRPQIAHAHTLQIKFTTLMTGSSYLIKKLQDMKRAHVKAVLDNGNTISTGLIDSASLDTAMGIDWEYTCDTGVDKMQKITFTLEMAVTNAEAILMVNGSPPADGTPDSGDIGNGLASYAIAADQRAAGIKLIELAATGGSYTDSFTTIEDTKFTAKSLSDTKDHRNRSTPIAVDVEVQAKLMQSGTAEVGNALVINQRLNDVRLTLFHTNVATSAALLVTLGVNVRPKFDAINAEGDIQKKAYMPMTATGKMTLAAWTACWPADIVP